MAKRQRSEERGCRSTAKRPAPGRKQHLYLVLDDWERGYSVRRLDVEDDSPRRRRRRDDQLEVQAGSKSSASSRSHSVICYDSDSDNAEIDNSGGDESQDRDDEEEDYDDDERDADEGNGIRSPPHGGVSARELERRLHQLLQSRHEARIAELESALERAQRKLLETEREACRWRDTAKLATRFADESRLR